MARRTGEEAVGKRSEIVTVRLDPKLKYLAELAARKQRRPLSSYIEWAVEQSLEEVALEEDSSGNKTTVYGAERMHHLWDLDEPDRIVRLALYFPNLLTHDEQMIWKIVRENGHVWKGRFSGSPPELEWRWEAKPEAIIWGRLRQHWQVFKAVAQGTKSANELPTWRKTKQHSPIDDDIPF
jgi:hypothetical protein